MKRSNLGHLPSGGLGWVVLACLLAAAPATAGGFAIFDQGTKATGLAGAFTAVANDPSTVFYNPGGVAFFEEGQAAGGATLLQIDESLFQGREPGRAAGTVGAQEEEMDVLPHLYWVKPVHPVAVLGFGIYQPFQLTTRWADVDSFAGRDVATAVDLSAYDLAAVVGLRATPSLGLGFGILGRTSDQTFSRRILRFNPLDRRFQDVADFDLETDMEIGVGGTVGLLYKPSNRFAWGLAYRSAIELDYTGTGTLTQIATGNDAFDELIAASLPLDEGLPLTTTVELPDVASFGLAFGLSERVAVSLQADWTGWSSFQGFEYDFPNDPDFSFRVPERFDDSLTYRLGLLYVTGGGFELRLGYAFDESPQPPETVGPAFLGGDKNIVSVGVGLDWLDLSVAWQQYDDRLITGQVDDLDGLYRDDRLVVAVSVAP
jgi:long-chain fatty acid transport protein